MTHMSKLFRKIITLSLVILIFIPLNSFFINEPKITSKNSNIMFNEENEKEFMKNPSLSVINLGYELKINDSEIYPNGTFYLYRSDFLKFELINDSAVSNVYLIVPALTINQAFTQSGNKFILGKSFDYAAGTYASKVSFIRNSKTVEINFYLDIKILGPQITKAWARDTTYNTQWTEIYEGGIYSTYRNTDVEFIVETYNREGPTSTLKLTYNDGVSSLSLNGQILSTNGNNRNFTFSQGTLNPIQVYIDTSVGNENRWKLSENLYTFKFNASYGNKYYIFEFYLEILNKPPKITQFDIVPGIVSNPSGKNTSVIIKVNATDFEDDQLWYRNTVRAAKYTDGVSLISNNSGCLIDSPTSPSYNYLNYDDSDFYDLTYLNNSNGELLLFVQINTKINISYIDWFQTNLVINDAATTNDDGKFEVWDYNANTWRLIANLSKTVDGWTTLVNRTDNLGYNVENLIPKSNYTIKFRIFYNGNGDIDCNIDKLTVISQVKRRDTFANVILTIYDPRANKQDIELINYWDDTNKIYWYKKDIINNDGNYGAWTFQIWFIDHGALDYSDLLWENFSKLYSIDYSSTGIAVSTKIFGLGIQKSEMLNITGIPTCNSSYGMNPKHNESINIKLDVSGVDTQSYNEYHKVYNTRKKVSEFQVQKNSSLNNELGETVSPSHGSLQNVTLDDDITCNITLEQKPAQNWGYYSVLWSVYLLDRFGLTYENITKLYIDIDSWFNDTSQISDVYFEFYNYSSNQWTMPTSGTWHNDANLKTTNHDTHFKRTLTNKNDFKNFISNNGLMRMRLRIEPSTILNNDIRLDIDFINITVEYDYYYIANLTLLGTFINQLKVNLKLTPTNPVSWTVKYSVIFNIYQLGLIPENFGLRFTLSNGNSSIFYLAYRRAPRVILGIDQVKKFINYYHYDSLEEINYINKNYTLSIQEPNYELNKTISFINLRGSTPTNNILFIRNRDELKVNATLKLDTLDSINDNLEFIVQIKEGLTESRSSWDMVVYSVKSSDDIYSYMKQISGSDHYNIYFIRFYFRSHLGKEYATDWQSYRIINFQPVDFDFTLFVDPLNLYRGDSISFQFSFLDYDMPVSWVQGNYDKITLRFLLNNKSNGNNPEWIDAVIDSHNYNPSYRHIFNCHLDIPYSVQTGQDMMNYSNWQFIIEDENAGEFITQYQKSFLNYTDITFTIKNRVPSITSLTLNDQAAGVQIYRHRNVTIKVYIQDNDEPASGLYLEVVDLNISTPASMLDVNVHNASVKVVGTHREYVYYVNRSAIIAQYNVSVKIRDSDGKEVSATTYFYVINSPPTVNSITFSQNYIYRNLDGIAPDYNPVIFYVNVSDAEDSYFGDNASASVTLTIDYTNPYKTKIQQVSNVLPVILNLTLKYPGNDTNGHTELWIGQYQFNETVNGQKLYAGILKLFANVTDGEGASGTLINTEFELYNYQPQKHSELDTEIGMEEASTYYLKSSVDENEDIEIYIFVSDKEGLASLKLWYIPLVGTPGQEVRDKAKTISLTSEDWNAEVFDTIGNTKIYKIKIVIPYEELPEDTVKIEIDDLVVYDNDYGYKDDVEQGATSVTFKEIRGVQIEINIKTESPKPPVIIYYLMIAGIVLLGIVVVIGIVYYRKRTGYRKFLD
ncbi:MAG: hypothetical protein ACP6IY_13250 [Promethearchaeia archaeon]